MDEVKTSTADTGKNTLPENRIASRAVRSTRGEIVTILVVVLVGGFVGFLSGRVTANKAGKPTSEGKAVAKLQQKIDITENKVTAENSAQGKVGQQFVAVTGSALDAASPEAKADPAVQLASKANAKAALALDHAMEPLTPAQMAWANQLVVDALSPEIARRAKAESSLSSKDAELQKSVNNEVALKSQVETLTDAKRVADRDLIDHDASASAFRANVRFWLFVLIGGYIGINYVLPLLVKAFPALSGVSTAVHAVWSGLWAKTLTDSKALARDASGALHNVLLMSADGAANHVIKEEAAKWITSNDNTTVRYQEALKDANVL